MNRTLIKIESDGYILEEIIQNKVEEFNSKYNGELKLIVRASGTENLLRVSCCARNKEDMEKLAAPSPLAMP